MLDTESSMGSCDRRTGYWLCENKVAQLSVKQMTRPPLLAAENGERLIIKARCGRIRALGAAARAPPDGPGRGHSHLVRRTQETMGDCADTH